jgi:hypothetical protein
MLNSEVWLHQQLREQLWRGLAAVSAYLSIATQLIGIALSTLFLKALSFRLLDAAARGGNDREQSFGPSR